MCIRDRDGTVLEESGTGQRHVIYAIDLVSDGVRTFTKTVSGETETELQRSIANGAGETPVSYTHLDVYKRQPLNIFTVNERTNTYF